MSTFILVLQPIPNIVVLGLIPTMIHFVFGKMEVDTSSISELEDVIYNHQTGLLSLPRFHPWRARLLESLAGWRYEHFQSSASHEQIDQSILHLSEALLLCPGTASGPTPNAAGLFFRLACSLHLRWTRFKQPGDIKACVKYFRYLRDQRHHVLDASPSEITLLLVLALSEQVESMPDPDKILENVEEMTILCRELFNSNSSRPLEYAFEALSAAFFACYVTTGEPPDQVIDFLREVNVRFPNSLEHSRRFAHCLALRFLTTFTNADYEEITTILDKVITSASDLPEDVRSHVKEEALSTIATLSDIRYVTLRKPEYLENSQTGVSMNLGATQEGSYSGASATDPDIVDLATLSSLTASLTEQDFSFIPDGEQWSRHIQALSTIVTITEIAESEEAIEYCRRLVVSVCRGPRRRMITCITIRALGDVLFRAFSRTGKIEYLNESIAALHDGLKMYGPGVDQHYLAGDLIQPLFFHFFLVGLREDLDEIMELSVSLVDDTYTTVPKRFRFSYDWAHMAHFFTHPSTVVAYEKALSLMQDSLCYAPTLETQHFRLISEREMYETLPLNYASYQIYTGQLNRAIETLERGRALLWSEMRGFHTSADQLAAVNSALAAEFVEINKDLEEVTMSMVPCGSMEAECSGVEDPDGMDPFGRLMMKQRKLLEKRDELISQIRTLPNFGSFLKSPKSSALRSAALRGPVIIVNHCIFRSDILILFRDSRPSLITTTKDFYKRALELGDRLVESRKGPSHRLESKDYQRTLRLVLGSLYELVGKPVIEEFRKMKIPEQSRVWWCPTSVFCHLPLHAMGPIPSNDGITRYFSDLYISSYTPTLSALIESRKPGGKISGKPSILLVAQPESLRHALPEIWAIQSLDTTVTSLISKKATPCSVVEGLRHHQFSHFVCHGNLDPGKPFNTSLELYGGQQLTLLEIVRSRLPTAEFAFLSACHTAGVTEKSIADEALHLTAAMQYCGFRSVVGTMWAMADEDGQFIVEDFYKSMLSSDEPGVPYHERSAQALRDAVKNLRRRGVPLERWVNYVHYGA
ncbi:CHAT domain-containing protein [Lactifluus volemus]|nr:CHAT domain-containing protein [Lactifluus volemus]